MNFAIVFRFKILFEQTYGFSELKNDSLAFILLTIYLQNAFEVIGISKEEVDSVLELVAAVLKLGNIEFVSRGAANGLEDCYIKNVQGL